MKGYSKGDITLIHLCRLQDGTNYKIIQHSAYIDGDIGEMFGTMKVKGITTKEDMQEFWMIFKEKCKESGVAVLTTTCPSYLASHYVKEYAGLTYSQEKAESPEDVRLECQLW